jgi:Uma2 family endonuclease
MATILKPPQDESSDELRFGAADAGRRIARADFARASFDEPFTYERVKGRLVVMSPAGPEHRGASRPFRRELGLYWGTHPKLVDDVDVEGWLATSEDDDRIPDICVYLAGSTSTQKVPDRVPDIVFEFVSGSRADQERDYIHKRAEYFAVGVKEYVIVDRFKNSVLVLLRGATDYEEKLLKAGDQYMTKLLPGLSINIDEVFRDG